MGDPGAADAIVSAGLQQNRKILQPNFCLQSPLFLIVSSVLFLIDVFLNLSSFRSFLPLSDSILLPNRSFYTPILHPP